MFVRGSFLYHSIIAFSQETRTIIGVNLPTNVRLYIVNTSILVVYIPVNVITFSGESENLKIGLSSCGLGSEKLLIVGKWSLKP